VPRDPRAGREGAEGTVSGLGRQWVLPPRFLLFVATAVAAGLPACLALGISRGWLVGFDAAAGVFLVSLAPLLRHWSVDQMRRRCAENDANRAVMVLLVAILTPVVLGAVGIEISEKNMPPGQLAFVVSTLVLLWFFLNSVFALHYAQMYYSGANGRDYGGIIFPKTPEPGYWDFFYFSYCLGMTFQTSDSNITSGKIRRVVTSHCMLGFLFSVGVIAFTVNVLGGGGGASVAAAH
jgi:uncharacterized membrane protein